MDEDAIRTFGRDHVATKTLTTQRLTALHLDARGAGFDGGAGLLLGFDVCGMHKGPNASFIAKGEGSAAASRILRAAPGFGGVDVVGRAVFDRYTSADGAPLVSRDEGTSRWIVTGLGAQGFFQMPSLARHICQRADPFEAGYWRAHSVLRGMTRQDLAEMGQIENQIEKEAGR